MPQEDFVALIQRVLLKITGETVDSQEIIDQISLLGTAGNNPYAVALSYLLFAYQIPLAIDSGLFKDSVITLDTTKAPVNLKESLLLLKEQADAWDDNNNTDNSWFDMADGSGTFSDMIDDTFVCGGRVTLV